MAVNCWSSTASRKVAHVPQSAQKPCRTPWKATETVKWRLRITFTTFYTASTRPMPQYSPPPLGIRTTSCHVKSSYICLSWKAACTSATIFCQLYISIAVVSIIYVASVSATVAASPSVSPAFSVVTYSTSPALLAPLTPPPEVFLPHPGRTSGAFGIQPPHRPL